MPGPTVTVIIAAYNAMPFLTRAVTSVVEQSIGREQLEVIVVDDGSTDGTAAELERLGGEHPGLVHVIHQENSGGPSAPRNVGLDHARGQFVFFLDADDYLGTEALERMVATAEKHGTDVVAGKMVGIGGRNARPSIFRQTQPRTDIFSSRAYWTLNPMKLFRRSLLEQHQLRFPTDLAIGEDQLFVGAAYLHASAISVLGDYDYLYWVLREDEGNLTRQHEGTEPRLRFLPRVIDMLVQKVPASPERDHLAHRHLTIEVGGIVRALTARQDRDVQEKTLRQLAETIEPLWHDGMNERLSALARLRVHLVRHHMLDEVLELAHFEKESAETSATVPLFIEDGRAYARYPFLRDPARAVPDVCYDVTNQLSAHHQLTRAELRGTTLHLSGYGYLDRVASQGITTALVLRERSTKTEHQLPVTPASTADPGTGADGDHDDHAQAGFTVTADLTTIADGKPLGDGLWDLFLTIGAQGLSKTVRIGSKRTTDAFHGLTTHVLPADDTLRAVTLYATKPHGNLTLDLGENYHDVLAHLSVDSPRWAADSPTEIEFTGRYTLGFHPDDALALVLDNGQGAVIVHPVHPTPGKESFTVRVPVTRLPAGSWTGALQLGPWTLPLPALPKNAAPAKWRRRGLPWYAKSLPSDDGQFSLIVAKTDLLKALTARVTS
ncbi:glycosyltransferase family 2 protein [Streptomyces broussonetiae]|uniref:Glycosyltransferase family 2 protein n=2 Tax=Streptomyces broussonetiae TaxID=2686304 RepID=A0ABV5ECY8_9ACTN